MSNNQKRNVWRVDVCDLNSKMYGVPESLLDYIRHNVGKYGNRLNDTRYRAMEFNIKYALESEPSEKILEKVAKIAKEIKSKKPRKMKSPAEKYSIKIAPFPEERVTQILSEESIESHRNTYSCDTESPVDSEDPEDVPEVQGFYSLGKDIKSTMKKMHGLFKPEVKASKAAVSAKKKVLENELGNELKEWYNLVNPDLKRNKIQEFGQELKDGLKEWYHLVKYGSRTGHLNKHFSFASLRP